MCGIAGIVQLNKTPDILGRQAELMADAISHRGPDNSGVWASQTHPIALSHRRLSILDTSASGHQPMSSHSGQHVIVFNGEIYNFRQLREQLARLDVTFSGHSDTEVLVNTIDTFGFEKAISNAKGMFALACWNNKTGKLTLARDRMGEKPLYYGIINNSFVFSSELKSIFEIFPANTLTIDQTALNQFLRFGYISSPISIFSEIKKVAPGEILEFDISNWQQKQQGIAENILARKYWDISDYAGNTNISLYQENDTVTAINDLEQLLSKVIEEQSIADVPLGSFLSGGIDSSLVTAMLQAQSDKAIDTFTIGFNEKEFNEAEHAKRIARHLGTTHHELYLSEQDALDVIPKLPELYDEPFADSSQIPTFLVSSFAKSQVKVCLSGDGGDELFAGYNRYLEGEKLNKLNHRLPKSLRHISSSVLRAIKPQTYDTAYKGINQLLGRTSGAMFGSKIHKAANVLLCQSAEELYRYLCSYHQNPEEILIEASKTRNLSSNLSFDQDFLAAAMAWDQQWYLPGDNLTKSDRASMGASLEMRTPLLDKEIVEFSWRVPNSMKNRNHTSKWLMRQLLYKHVPQKLIDRPKMGFSVPIDQWLRGSLREWSEDLLSEDFLISQNIFNPENTRKLYQAHIEHRGEYGNQLWPILMFQAWYKKYITTNN